MNGILENKSHLCPKQFDGLDQQIQLHETLAHECLLLRVIPSRHIHEVINKIVFVLLKQILLSLKVQAKIHSKNKIH
jgi:hypothetical protein